jgi:hypothetical protein
MRQVSEGSIPNSLITQPLRVVLVVAKALIWTVVIMWIANLPVRPVY